eukprot:gnl/Dysnectes_brevis/3159_a3941_610.p1 GENE.gnl/Dysnectes_brevis/3159_a3941_610~~gnl/Dysnectes_brevis/3159_a3941_610.p1  ORF type:complete len:240 (-),score=44.39 gnl/Dysnectes_brevis/3159_a3941_610:367-1086(-)
MFRACSPGDSRRKAVSEFEGEMIDNPLKMDDTPIVIDARADDPLEHPDVEEGTSPNNTPRAKPANGDQAFNPDLEEVEDLHEEDLEVMETLEVSPPTQMGRTPSQAPTRPMGRQSSPSGLGVSSPSASQYREVIAENAMLKRQLTSMRGQMARLEAEMRALRSSSSAPSRMPVSHPSPIAADSASRQGRPGPGPAQSPGSRGSFPVRVRQDKPRRKTHLTADPFGGGAAPPRRDSSPAF